jgi:two-component system, response regulator RegA
VSSDSPTLLIVEDDDVMRRALAKAFTRRGFAVREAATAAAAAEHGGVDCAVVDLKLPDGSGLEVVAALRAASAATRIVVLTGYASIATAVTAIKLGATNYLTKPATPDEIRRALDQAGNDTGAEISEYPPSVARLQWEHIQRVLADHDGNISATARALGMHRRTLQRKLAKRPVRR